MPSSGETLDLKSAISSDLLIACPTPWVNAIWSKRTQGKYHGWVQLKEKVYDWEITWKVLQVLEVKHNPWRRLGGPRAVKIWNYIYLQYINIIFHHPNCLLVKCPFKSTALQSPQSAWIRSQKLWERLRDLYRKDSCFLWHRGCWRFVCTAQQAKGCSQQLCHSHIPFISARLKMPSGTATLKMACQIFFRHILCATSVLQQ